MADAVKLIPRAIERHAVVHQPAQPRDSLGRIRRYADAIAARFVIFERGLTPNRRIPSVVGYGDVTIQRGPKEAAGELPPGDRVGREFIFLNHSATPQVT